jgi:putative tricarboxylic transport membrane protein
MASTRPERPRGFGGRLTPAIPYLLLLLATVWLWTVAAGIDYPARPGALGPDFWPRAALALMGALCVFQIGRLLLVGSGSEPHGIAAELETEHEDEDEAPRRPILLTLGVALTTVYALVLETLGFPLATAGFLVAFMYLGGSRRHLAIWASSLTGTALVTVLLMKVVYVSLPRGTAPFDRIIDVITGF